MRKFTLSFHFMAICLLGFFACSQSSSSGELNYVKKDAPQPGAAAKIFGEVVAEKDLETNNIRVYQKRLEVYQTLRREVDERVRKKVFDELAAKAKVSVDEYMNKEMEVAKKKITDKAVGEFLKGRIEDPAQAPQHIKDQVKGILHLQNIVADFTKKNPVELYLERPRAPELAFNMEGASMWGNKDAPVTVIEYSDFQCPFCKRADDMVVKELKKKYGKNKIKVVFKHFPLSIHQDAKPASVASLCVQEQNMDKFWAMHDTLFNNQRNLGEEDLKAYAKKVGADMTKFEECVKSKKYEAQVQADFDEGVKVGVNSTPSFFINSQPILGARPLEEFSEIIDEELSSKKKL